MKVILQQDVKGQGKKGQMVEVSDGYGRNFLLPRKLAVEATAENVNTRKMQDKAKAADELLTLTGIHASFVLFPDGERVILSARSSGDVNVQVIVEALGGGGNAQVAGAQIAEKTIGQVTAELTDAINNYCDNA